MTTDRLSFDGFDGVGRMTGVAGLDQRGITTEIASSLPRFDPLAKRRNTRTRVIMTLSLIVNLAALWALWGWKLGAIIEEDPVVIVRMIEEVKPPEPEPERARPKALARRVVNAKPVKVQREVQNEVRKLAPTPVLAQAQKVEINKVRTTEAPKKITQRKFQTQTINEFAETPVREEVAFDPPDAATRPVVALEQSAGPKLTESASPIDNPTGSISAPYLAEGKAGNRAAPGTPDGTIASLESGNSTRYTTGDGTLGYQTGVKKDCMKDPVCLRYLQMIQDRVYQRWSAGGVDGGQVKLRFQIDKSGGTHGIKLVDASSASLGASCETAFRHASPFPPPPASIHYLVREGIVATFTLAAGQGSSE